MHEVLSHLHAVDGAAENAGIAVGTVLVRCAETHPVEVFLVADKVDAAVDVTLIRADLDAVDHTLRDAFTEIALLKLTGAQRVDEIHTAARTDVEAVSKSKKPVKRKGAQLEEEKGLSEAG